MKRFLRNVILLILTVGACFGSLALFDRFVVGPQYTFNYQASLLDKLARLESIKEPKIILVGHSNLSFGMDSAMLEEAMGMPVVNLGLHGGLGNAFHEEIAKNTIREGDIVIVCHSSFSDTDEITDASLAWITLDNHEGMWKLIRKKDYPVMIKAYPEYLRNSLFLWFTGSGNIDAGGCFSRSAFNAYGDVVFKPEYGQMDVDEYFASTGVSVPLIGDVCIDRLNEYNRFIRDRGATMLVAGYPIAYGKDSSFSEEDFAAFGRELRERLDCEVISDYEDYFYPYAFFYNTDLHLTEEGTEARTRQLISDLKRWQEGTGGREQ
ncbi:MAG: hypothetical protein K6E50_08950 [Lachnospiraceae bacterium]|nr:hypothetical protein [Lachnospiraceae bacterium]